MTPDEVSRLINELSCIVTALLEISDHLKIGNEWLKEIDKSIGYIDLECN